MRRNGFTVAIAVLACLAVSGVGFAVGNLSLGQEVAVQAGVSNVAYRAPGTDIPTGAAQAYISCNLHMVSPWHSNGWYWSTELAFTARNFSTTDYCGYNGFTGFTGFTPTPDERVLAIVNLGSIPATLTSAVVDCYVNGVSEAVQSFGGIPDQCGDFIFLDSIMLQNNGAPTAPLGAGAVLGYGALVGAAGIIGPVSSGFPGESVLFDVQITAAPVLT